jgi:hypothetical protein
MKVRIDGWAWLDRSALSDVNLRALRTKLTVQPRLTTDVAGKAIPRPIHLYRDLPDEGLFGVPRGFYRVTGRGNHDEDVRVSYGSPMQPMESRYRADGVFAEQLRALDRFAYLTDEVPWGGFILCAGCGFGKALRNSEPVLLERGFVPIVDVRIGDRIYGTDGDLHTVTGVFPQGKRQLYRVKFSDGTCVDCDGEHQWSFVLRRRKGTPIHTVVTKDLVSVPLRNKSGWQYWLPPVAPVMLSKTNIPVDPYTLGVVVGDGCTRSKTIKVTKDDIELSSLVKTVYPDRVHVCKNDGSRCRTFLIGPSRVDAHWGSPLKRYLESVGLWGLKSTEKFVPDEYKYGSVDTRIEFLRGLFDCDASAISSGLVDYSTSSKRLADDVEFMIRSLGAVCTVKPRNTFYTKDGVKVGPFGSYRFKVRFPREMIPFRLQRKYEKALHGAWQRKLGRYVVSVDVIDNDLATCITVDSPDRLYLTRGFVPTHNSNVSIEFARRLGRSTLIVVHKEFFLNQWRDYIQDVMPDARVGYIQQNRCDYKDVDFSIAMIQSLARGLETGKYPTEMWSAFGLVINDEVHRTGAASWSSVVPMFNAAWRFGVSATPRRPDGCENVFFHHIGPIEYTGKVNTMTPSVRTLYTGSHLKEIRRGPTYKVTVDKLNSAQVIGQLVDDQQRTKFIVDDIIAAVRKGRKVMVVSHRLQHLRDMAQYLSKLLMHGPVLPFVPVLDFYTSEWFVPGTDRMEKRTQDQLRHAEGANVIFATLQMVSEGLNIQALDTLVLATPMSDVEQPMGRVRRWCLPDESDGRKRCKRLCAWRAETCQGKPNPLVVDVLDEHVAQAQKKSKARLRFYRSESCKL